MKLLSVDEFLLYHTNFLLMNCLIQDSVDRLTDNHPKNFWDTPLADNLWQDQLALRRPTADPARLTRQVTTLIERAQVSSGVTALTLQLSDLVTLQPEQVSLFTQTHPTEQWQRFRDLLPRLVSRYGSDCFFEPVLTSPQSVLPERRFQFRRVGNE